MFPHLYLGLVPHLVNKLLEIQLLADNNEANGDLLLVKKMVEHHVRDLAVYLCDSCGFKATNFHWHCPACNSWESLPSEPIDIIIDNKI